MSTTSKKILVLCLAAVLAFVFCGCGPSKPGSDPSTSGAPGGEPKTFTFCMPYEIGVLEPQKSTSTWDMMAIVNCHDPLVRMTPQGEVIPWLAKSWEVSDDGLIYTFHLEKGVKFQNGTEMTAEDVKFSLDRAKESPQAVRTAAFMKEITVVDPLTVKIELNWPASGALKFLSLANNCVVSKKYVEEVGEDYKTKPCGTGPFQLEQWDLGDKVVFKAFPDYFKGKPAIDKLTIKTIKESTTAVIALKKHEIDAMISVPAVYVKEIEESKDLTYQQVASVTFWGLLFNCQMEPFNNPTLRKALYLAIDQQEIVDVAKDGLAEVANQAIHKNNDGFIASFERWPKDLEESKRLLAEAGYPDGFSTSIYVREDWTQKLGQVVQNQLSKVNVNIEIVPMERNAWYKDMVDGKLGMYPCGTGDLILDAEIPLGNLESVINKATNYPHYSSDAYDDLFHKYQYETDQAKRMELIEQMLNIEKNDCPRVPILFDVNNLAHASNIEGLEPFPNSFYFFYPVKFK